MASPPCRPFTVLDAMILVAATAVGSSAFLDEIEPWWDPRVPRDALFVNPTSFLRGTESPTEWAVSVLFWTIVDVLRIRPMLVAWSYGAFLLRLRRPRPPMRRLARQP